MQVLSAEVAASKLAEYLERRAAQAAETAPAEAAALDVVALDPVPRRRAYREAMAGLAALLRAEAAQGAVAATAKFGVLIL